MSNGIGASLGPVRRDGKGQPEPGGPWKVRWREWVDEAGERKQRARSKTFHHAPGSKSRTPPPAAVKFHAEVIRALEEGTAAELGRPEPARREVRSFDDAVGAWLTHKAARGLAQSSLDKYGRHVARFFSSARKVLGLPAEAPVPLDVVTRDLLAAVILDWRGAGLSEATVYSAAATMLDAWTYSADDPDTWHGVIPAPRDKSTVLPLPPVYSAPVAPTLAECDACIRRLPSWAYVARGAAIVMRYTGLRVSQVLALQRDDLDAGALTLTVRTGKSRRERAAQRAVPISRHMLDDLAAAGCLAHDGPGLLRRRRDLRSEPTRSHHPREAIRNGWEGATAAGEARREVWDPPTRKNARPEHAFRAALQGHLAAAGVASEVADAIVGHAASTTRARHYSGPAELWDAMRRTVDALPPIDWTGPESDEATEPEPEAAAGGNVLRFPGTR